ncbi:MAG: SpoIIE family protein phosphatase [Actinomycetota bacterium]|nr:SpoIIE family protein phosphatase [Actinomycetota bacterium]
MQRESGSPNRTSRWTGDPAVAEEAPESPGVSDAAPPYACTEDIGCLPVDEVLQAIPEPLVIADASGQVVFADPSVHELLGWPSGTLVGQPLDCMIPERLLESHLTGFGRALAKGGTSLGSKRLRVMALRRDGQEMEVDLRVGNLRGPGRRRGKLWFVATIAEAGEERLLLEVALASNTHLRVTTRLATMVGRPDVTPEGVAPAALALLGTGLGWDFGALWAPDVEGTSLVPLGTWARGGPGSPLASETLRLRPRQNQGMPGRAWATGKPVWVEDLPSTSRIPRGHVARQEKIAGWIAVPLTSGGTVHGVLELARTAEGRLSADLLSTLSTAGQVLGQLFDRVHAQRQLLAAQERLEVLARTFETSLLPPELPRLAWVDVGAVFRPGGMGDVGGDFYDVFAMRGEAWHVAIGDVCGRGAAAAVVASLARHTVRAAAMQYRSPAAVLRVLNRAVETELSSETFLTALCLRMEPSTAGLQLTLASGGHPLPLHVRRDGTVVTVGRTGTLVGALGEVEFVDSSLCLAPGELLICFTDGVTEARGPDGFFAELLAPVVAAKFAEGDCTAGAMAEAIERAATDFSSSSERDDLAVVVLKAI